MPDGGIMNACDVWKVSLSIFICFVFSGRSEATQDPVSLRVQEPLCLKLVCKHKRLTSYIQYP